MNKYRHYKGGVYEIICTATLESDRDVQMVVYKEENGMIWTRPVSDFYEHVEHDGQLISRFKVIE